jgi:hypothetical protein
MIQLNVAQYIVNIYSIICLFLPYYRIWRKILQKIVLKINNGLQDQTQATNDGLTLTDETNTRTIDALRNTDKSIKLIIQ